MPHNITNCYLIKIHLPLTSLEFTERYLKPHSLEMVIESNSKYIIFIINVSRQNIWLLYITIGYTENHTPLNTYPLVLSILKT